ncbi:MAG TPA: hypothetical protein VK633_07115 [Verrucomicrobiae bacterium]|nr:hypothetical protein [Verrucomicrobiae bacterium]
MRNSAQFLARARRKPLQFTLLLCALLLILPAFELAQPLLAFARTHRGLAAGRYLQASLCLSCGRQFVTREFTLFGSRYLSSTRELPISAAAKAIGLDRSTGEHRLVNLGIQVRSLDLNQLKIRTIGWGAIRGDPFYADPTLQEVLARISATNQADAEFLLKKLQRLQSSAAIPRNFLQSLSHKNILESSRILALEIPFQ